jgi:pilus assembly protein CpaF
MNTATIQSLQKSYENYWSRIQSLSGQDYAFSDLTLQDRRNRELEILQNVKLDLDPQSHSRLDLEILGFGPLEALFEDESITEILVNESDMVWIERGGKLERFSDFFLNLDSYKRIIDRICEEAKVHVDLEQPQVDGKFRDFRLSLVGPGMTESKYYLSLRRHPKNPWSLNKLHEKNWCNDQQIQDLRNLVADRNNFLVIGNTGSGKTSLLNALLNEISDEDRAILIEDTQELNQPNTASIRLLTRNHVKRGLDEITQTDLIKKSLRLRPDRLVMGEIRGTEAKDFLLMLSTGHGGSMGTLHANDPHQALARLEMLVQMGAPEWSLTTIRRLIFLSLQNIVVVERDFSGSRQLKGIYRLQSLEEWGFVIEKMSDDIK